MQIQLINNDLLVKLHQSAQCIELKRVNFDLRTTPNDLSQRMLNVMEPGTDVPIHRHLNTSETVVCLTGCLDWVIYELLPKYKDNYELNTLDILTDKSLVHEVRRFRISPREQIYGIQIPCGVWHSVEVYEPSTIMEAKDGPYRLK